MMRNRHLFHGKFKEEIFDFNTSIEDFRQLYEQAANKYSKMPDGIQLKEDTIMDIKSEWITPNGANEKNVIMYVHGGGYVPGSCDDHRAFVSKFAKNCGITCL